MNKDTLAFPANGVPGMTLRAYLVAHAPAEPQAWFSPVIEQVAEPEPFAPGSWPAKLIESAIAGDWSKAQIDEQLEMKIMDDKSQAEVARRINQIIEVHLRRKSILEGAERERYLQWPLAWADAMLEKLAE